MSVTTTNPCLPLESAGLSSEQAKEAIAASRSQLWNRVKAPVIDFSIVAACLLVALPFM